MIGNVLGSIYPEDKRTCRHSLISVDVGSTTECRTAPTDQRSFSGRSFLRCGGSWSTACRRCRGTSGDRVPVRIAIEFRVYLIPT